MNIAALAAATLLATAPLTTPLTTPPPPPLTTPPPPTVEYVPLNQVPNWYKTLPYMHTGVCMITEQDITCATDTHRKHTTLNNRYTQALYMFIKPPSAPQKEPPMLANITDVYGEIRNTLGEYAGNFNIEGIANTAYTYNPTTHTYNPSPEVPFWTAAQANANTNTQGN